VLEPKGLYYSGLTAAFHAEKEGTAKACIASIDKLVFKSIKGTLLPFWDQKRRIGICPAPDAVGWIRHATI
jgi:hypothetical protein